jgi:hypothetical protein
MKEGMVHRSQRIRKQSFDLMRALNVCNKAANYGGMGLCFASATAPAMSKGVQERNLTKDLHRVESGQPDSNKNRQWRHGAFEHCPRQAGWGGGGKMSCSTV